MTPNEKPRYKALLIVGAGVMGQGIARLFARAGMTVTLVDSRDVDFAHPGVTLLRHLPPDLVPELVIEAVFEDRAVKRSVRGDRTCLRWPSRAGDEHLRPASERIGRGSDVSPALSRHAFLHACRPVPDD